jgi:DNA-binding LytR/AlgR family response regulator
MTRLKCLIVDDEPVARKIIREYMGDHDFLELMGEAETTAGISKYAPEAIDIIFLDVQMPGTNGIDFLRTVSHGALTILTTAYPDYALQGYELDVLDYLVKPISSDRFARAVLKARDFHQLRTRANTHPSDDVIVIKCDRILERIPSRSILYVEAMANYVIVHTAKRRYITYQKLSGMQERLPSSQFIRIHKSYLIGLQSLSRIQGNKAILGSIALPISRTYRANALQQVNSHQAGIDL